MQHKLNSALATACAVMILITGLVTATTPIFTTLAVAGIGFVAVLAFCYFVDFLHS